MTATALAALLTLACCFLAFRYLAHRRAAGPPSEALWAEMDRLEGLGEARRRHPAGRQRHDGTKGESQ